MPKRRRINWVVSDVVRRVRKIWLETSARLRGQLFYCAALSGQSEYNITINCDGTLTCNCHDYNGSGNLGDLNQQSFRDIFFGAKAQSFRDSLAQGKLPLCAEMCSTKSLLAGDGDVIGKIYKDRVEQRGYGSGAWGWTTAYKEEV